MLQIRPNDLVAVRMHDGYFLFAILTKQTLFGGHWCFVFHGSRSAVPSESAFEGAGSPGFNAAVDFIVPKREERVVRISRSNDFSKLLGPELLQQAPLKGEVNYRVWRWKDHQRIEAEFVRFTSSPTRDELHAPHYSCMPADFACDLAARRWTAETPMWGF